MYMASADKHKARQNKTFKGLKHICHIIIIKIINRQNKTFKGLKHKNITYNEYSKLSQNKTFKGLKRINGKRIKQGLISSK